MFEKVREALKELKDGKITLDEYRRRIGGGEELTKTAPPSFSDSAGELAKVFGGRVIEINGVPSPVGLTAYGIQTEKCDYRVHVCVAAKVLYVFTPSDACAAIASGRFRSVSVRDRALTKTAEGYLVPPLEIGSVTTLEPPADFDFGDFSGDTSSRGRAAVSAFVRLLPYLTIGGEALMSFDEFSGRDSRQLEGKDGEVTTVSGKRLTVEIKCDMRGGEQTRGGTGNLFLQTGERNQYGQI
jgi:hypothetical protein